MPNTGPGMIVDVEQAVERLRAGELVAFPTETVYGLGADALNRSAIGKVFSAKGRPPDHPLIVHLPNLDLAQKWSSGFSNSALRLATEFWPGPLTLIVKRAEFVPLEVTGGQETVGLRVPSHPVAQELLSRFGGGIAGPSANRFGKVSSTSADDVLREFPDSNLGVLDGGTCVGGIESTIVDCSGDSLAILRPGLVTAEQIFESLGIMPRGREASSPRTAGGHQTHYSPSARVVILSPVELDILIAKVAGAESGNRYMLCVAGAPSGLPRQMKPVPVSGDPVELASRLYSLFRQADREGYSHIVFLQPEPGGVGVAIADRLNRAAAREEV